MNTCDLGEIGIPLFAIELRIRIVAISTLSWTTEHRPRMLPPELEVAVQTVESFPSTSMGQFATLFCVAEIPSDTASCPIQ
jgi:hypothetical protein